MNYINNNKNILLYNGFGSEEFCVKKTEESFKEYLGNRSVSVVSVDASYFTAGNLKNAQAVVIPGGNVFKIAMDFNRTGIEQIRDFVFSGGSYIGFCAGAYFAGPVCFNRIPIDCDTNLISCTLEGPAFDLGDAKLLNEKTARAVLVKNAAQEEFHVFWNGGGYYSQINHFVHNPIVCYQEEPNKWAVISTGFNNGSVVLSNIHPEIQLSESEIDTYPNINKVDFLASIPKQKALFSEICNIAGLCK
jgi:biotin--protein ligase